MSQAPNQNQLEALLKVAAQRMGTTPQALKAAAQRGDLSSLVAGSSGQDAAALQKVLSDPEKAAVHAPGPKAVPDVWEPGQINLCRKGWTPWTT